ncbi:MAG: hypothetical protein U5K54_03505 [Cytophagales bacterium]|nr:hypothetical protein [Cytophagales bacterium]
MMSLIIGLGVVLVLAILYLIFRIGNLVELVKGKKDDVSSWNTANAYLLMLFMIGGLVSFVMVFSCSF